MSLVNSKGEVRRWRPGLESLKKGEVVRVDWFDASTVKNVPYGEEPEPDMAMTSVGEFEGILQGKKIRYLMITVEKSDSHKDVTLIPIPLIHRVSRLMERKSLKAVRVTNYCRTVREYGE